MMKFILKFSLTLSHQDSFTSLHLLNFLFGVLPRKRVQVLKKLLLENGCNLADDNGEKFIKGRKMKKKKGILQIIDTLGKGNLTF